MEGCPTLFLWVHFMAGALRNIEDLLTLPGFLAWVLTRALAPD